MGGLKALSSLEHYGGNFMFDQDQNSNCVVHVFL
jgi:hypothetical protein